MMLKYKINGNLIIMKNFYFLLLTLFSVGAFAQVQIGTDTNQSQDAPFDPASGYSYVQSIYLASEINANGTINQLQWYFSGTTQIPNSQDITVFLGHTSKSEFTSTSDWELFSNLTQVYTGTIDVSGGEGWVTITFDSPFTYNGTDNLIVAVDENMAGTDNFQDDFYNSPVSTVRTMAYKNFSNNPDPASPPSVFGSGLDAYIPNVIFGGITQTCPVPTDAAVSSITTNTASIDWTIGGSETSWDIALGVEGFTLTTATETNISKPYGASNLTANTAYEFYLRANCGGGDFSAWNGPFAFRTACDAVINDFSEDFNTMPDDLITPYCWNTIITTTGTDNPAAYVDSNFATPENKYYYMSADEEDTVMLISPNSSTLSDGTTRIEFNAEISNDAYGTPLLIGTMTDPLNASTFTELSSILLTEDYVAYYVNVPPSTDTYFAFKHGANSSLNTTIYIDDIVVTTQPSCIEVIDVDITNITNSQFDLSINFDTQQAQTAWDYIVKVNPGETYNPATEILFGSTTTTNVTAITTDTDAAPIMGNTEYWVYARANCDDAGSAGSGKSDWVGPFTFRTACSASNDFTENFDTLPDDLVTPYCWYTVLSTTDTGDDPTAYVNYSSSSSQWVSGNNYYYMSADEDDTVILAAPESLELSDGTHRVEFYAKISTTTYNTPLIVGRMTDPNDANTFVELATFELSTVSDETHNYTKYYVNVPFDNTGLNYFAFKHGANSTSNTIIYLDDVLYTTQPNCFQVLDVTASNVTDMSFDLNLTVDSQVQTEWELVVVQTDLNFNPNLETPIVTNTLNTNITLDSDGNTIQSNSPYRVFARANCDASGSEGSGTSEWFGPYDFVTACATYEMGDLTFPEMFEAANNDEIIPCWSAVVSEGTGYVRYSSIQEYDGSSSVRLYYPAATPTSAYQMLVSPAFSDLSSNKQVKIWVYDDNNSTLSVGTMTDATNPATFTEIQRFNNGVTDDFETPGDDTNDDIPDDTWTELTIDFTSHNGTDQYIAFRMLRRSSFASMYLDTFTYLVNPSLSTNDVNLENSVNIYPNPTKNKLYIAGNNIEEITIYTINGKKLLTKNLDTNSVDVSALQSGMYFINIKSINGSTTVKKFLKN